METFKNPLGEVILTSIHNMCFSDKILFLQTWFKVIKQTELLKN